MPNIIYEGNAEHDAQEQLRGHIPEESLEATARGVRIGVEQWFDRHCRAAGVRSLDGALYCDCDLTTHEHATLCDLALVLIDALLDAELLGRSIRQRRAKEIRAEKEQD